MKRLIEQDLKKWKESDRRKPLIIRGVRQVGKTYSVKEFGEKYFENTAFVDFERNPDWHKIFEENLQVKRICRELEVLLNCQIIPGKTLLFFDEIQECPKAISSLRYFYEEMQDLHVIAAGSLLEFAMKEISIPVGRVQYMHQYPLCFAEYLNATGHSEAMDIVLGTPGEVSDVLHEFLMKELRNYFFIGGMPESVSTYINTNSLLESFEVQKEICETYRMDFAKYTPHVNRYCINAVLTSVSQNIGHQVKYATLSQDFSGPTIKKAFDLLCLANIIRKVSAANPSGLPLGASASLKVFKAILADIGIMRYLSGMPVDMEYNNPELLDIFRGAMAEQFIGQELAVAREGELYYWSRQEKSSSSEVDYLFVINNRIFPVEVKSGVSGRLKSLHYFLREYNNSPAGIVFSSRPYSELPERKIIFMPLYFAYSAANKNSDLGQKHTIQ